jgi:chromosome segregation ATPase
MRKALHELERRLTEAAEKLEEHYEGRRAEMRDFEEDLVRRLEEWAKGLHTLAASVEALHKRQDQLEADQKTLAEHLGLLAASFKKYADG